MSSQAAPHPTNTNHHKLKSLRSEYFNCLGGNMGIKFLCALALALSAAVLATAETKDATTINIESLARVDGIASYCGRVDPQHSSLYQQRSAAFVRGHSDSEIKGDRSTSRYQFAFGAVNQDLNKLAPNLGAGNCSALIKGMQ